MSNEREGEAVVMDDELRLAEDERGPEERQRVGYHESGHATATYVLQSRIDGPVSINPTKAWNGVAFVGARRASASDWSSVDVSRPMAVWPARLRRNLECRVLILLAGPAAEWLRPVSQPFSGYLPTAPDEALAERVAVAALSPGERLLLAHGDERDPGPGDEARAFELAHALHGERAGVWLAWLRSETRELVASWSFQRRLHPLAEALFQAGDLGRADVLRILRNPSERSKTWRS